jgi:hypothetical protein
MQLRCAKERLKVSPLLYTVALDGMGLGSVNLCEDYQNVVHIVKLGKRVPVGSGMLPRQVPNGVHSFLQRNYPQTDRVANEFARTMET